MSHKLTPLISPFSNQIAAVLEQYPKQDGYLLGLFRVFANSLRFLTKGVPNLLDKESPLVLSQREIIILRVTANNDCEYEWGVHVSIFAKAAGLTPEQINATKTSTPHRSCWTTEQQCLLQIVDQLTKNGGLDESAQIALQLHWTAEQQLEICTLCGTYQTISYVANIAELDNEPFAARFP